MKKFDGICFYRDYDGYRHYQGSRSSSRQGYNDYNRAWDAYYANYNRDYGYGYNQGYVQGLILLCSIFNLVKEE
jgi:hypothetical protein